MKLINNYLIISTFIIIGLLLAACGAATNATPTVDPNTVITEVAKTVQAGFQFNPGCPSYSYCNTDCQPHYNPNINA